MAILKGCIPIQDMSDITCYLGLEERKLKLASLGGLVY